MFNVYKLSCNKTGLDYYGSTTDTVEERLIEHESNYKCHLKGTRKEYCSSFEIIKNGNYEIKLLEECDDKIHMIERETFYFDNFECVNIYRPCVPGRTRKEYCETFKVEIAQYQKEYREEHKEKIAEYHKEYHKEWYE